MATPSAHAKGPPTNKLRQHPTSHLPTSPEDFPHIHRRHDRLGARFLQLSKAGVLGRHLDPIRAPHQPACTRRTWR